MVSFEDFESQLKEVVNGKRLSASKMEKLTEIAMKSMDKDTQLVSILYRTHKTLPPNAKISSLYVFDALSRAAHHQATRRGQTGDNKSKTGNCATFLLKIEGVLDGLFQDLLSSGAPEAKEKTKKILDIWTKANTFPASVITRLGALGRAEDENEAQTSQESKQNGVVGQSTTPPSTTIAPMVATTTSKATTDPRKHPTPPLKEVTPPSAVASTSASVPTPTAESAQATLLALLASAAGNSQTTPNSVLIPAPSVPPVGTGAAPAISNQNQLNPVQLALIQQLAGAGSTSGAANSQIPPVPPLITHPFAPNGSSSQSFSPVTSTSNQISPVSNQNYQNPRPGPGPSSYSNNNINQHTGYINYGDQSSERRPSRFSDTGNRQSFSNNNERYGTGGYRQMGDPRRGRGGFRGRDRDDYRGNQRDHENRNSNYNYGNGRDTYERRDSHGSRMSRSRSPPARRDERSSFSPARYDYSSMTPTTPGRSVNFGGEPGKDEFGRDLRQDQEEAEDGEERSKTRSPVRSPARVEDGDKMNSNSIGVTSKVLSGSGLDTFDFTTFDPTNPTSWVALGNSFQVTNGYLPSQEELMQLVMGEMMNMASTMGGMASAIPADMMDNATASNVVDQSQVREKGFANDMYAVNSNPGEMEYANPQVQNSNAWASQDSFSLGQDQDQDKGSSTGQMKKIGDRWVFMRQ